MTRLDLTPADDAPDADRSRRFRLLLLVAAAVTIGAGLAAFVSLDRPREPRPDLHLRSTLAPVPAAYVPPFGPRERALAILEPPVGGRP